MTLQFDATESDLVLFLEEAVEQLETLSDGLLRMERDAGDAQLIQAVFRAAHTLKGSSATIGHQRMAALTHAMESVLDNIRKGSLSPNTEGVIDTLLACIDTLNVLNEEVQTKVESSIDIAGLVARLHVAATAKPVMETVAPRATTAVEQTDTAQPAAQDGTQTFEVEVTVVPASEWPAVRAYQALMELAPLGTVMRSTPTEDELQAGESGHTLLVVLETSREPDVLERAVASVTDIASVNVRLVNGEPVDAPAPEERVDDEGSLPAATDNDRRRADLGPEMRGAPADEQVAVAGQRLATAARMVKVDIARLDEMMNLVGELVIDRGRMLQVQRELGERFGNDPGLEHLSDITQHLSRVSDDLQASVMLSRLLPVESVFNRFPRMVRDLARKSGKEVCFVMEGQETGLDRSVIDEIGDPLLHLLRNAVDHGVETPEERRTAGKGDEATLVLSARHEESQIVIDVRDDGRGIDPQKLRDAAVRKGLMSAENAGRLSDDEAINLIFAPGFSSAETVTDVSGRGVGMDIVRTNIEKINGSVNVHTRVGEGTTFSIRLPLTLAIINALLVRVGEAVFTIPLASVHETMRIRTDSLHTVQQREVVLVRGHALPLVRLSEVFARGGQRVERLASEWCYVVAVRTGRSDLGLVVDALIGEQEVVIKSIGGAIGDVEGIAGATILGDGRVSMIVDVPKVVDRLAMHASA